MQSSSLLQIFIVYICYWLPLWKMEDHISKAMAICLNLVQQLMFSIAPTEQDN